MRRHYARNTVTTLRAAALMVASLLVFAGGASAAVSVSFQDGVSQGGTYAGTGDTHIAGDNRGSAPDTNYGTATTFAVFERETSINNFIRTLIRFDLSSLSSGTPVYSASLTLTNASGTGTSNGFQARGITNSLYVVDPANVTWDELTATWNEADTVDNQPWAGGPGVASSTAAIATAATPNGPTNSVNKAMTFTIDAAGIAAISGWINNPSSNTGFFIRQPDGSNSIDSFYSSEYATDPNFRPLLVLSVPEPASLGLLSVGGLFLLRRRAHR